MSGELGYMPEERRQSILESFEAKGDFPAIMDAETLGKLLDKALELDEAYMEASGAEEGGVYDDDAAYDYMQSRMSLAFPEYKAYMMRFVEDYLDYNEAFLDEKGLIDWE